jgi:hypothetical protein
VFSVSTIAVHHFLQNFKNALTSPIPTLFGPTGDAAAFNMHHTTKTTKALR